MTSRTYQTDTAPRLAPLGEVTQTPLRESNAASPKLSRTRFGTMAAFLKNGTCSKTLMTVMNRELAQPMPTEEAASDPLAGGLMQGYQCGMIWGSTLAAGAKAYRELGPVAAAEATAVTAAKRLTETFRGCMGNVNCLEITETDPKNGWQVFVHFFVKGGVAGCMKRAADFAPRAFEDINAAFAEKPCAGRCRPGNCAAKLARAMGASDLRATMASGFAGGIGLSGGACGALAAAIWLTGIEGRETGEKGKVVKQRIADLIDAFLKASNFEFECREIVGREFESVEDHADHVQQGGCAAIIDALVAVAKGEVSVEETRLSA